MLTYSDNTSVSLDDIPADYYQFDFDFRRSNLALISFNSTNSWQTIQIYPLDLGETTVHGRLRLGQAQCTDDELFSQRNLMQSISIVSKKSNLTNNDRLSSSPSQHSDHYIILNANQSSDQRSKVSPLLITVSILLSACVVLFVSFFVHWFINCYAKRKPIDPTRQRRNSTHSGAEEDNHDWIFLDRNSLEMPVNQPQCSPSVHNSTLHITPNPLINTSTLQRQPDLPELSHSQMIAYFDNLKESHA